MTGDQASDIILARFADGSTIFGMAEVTLSNGSKTTAYDVGLAHEKKGMLEVFEADGVTIKAIRLERRWDLGCRERIRVISDLPMGANDSSWARRPSPANTRNGCVSGALVTQIQIFIH